MRPHRGLSGPRAWALFEGGSMDAYCIHFFVAVLLIAPPVLPLAVIRRDIRVVLGAVVGFFAGTIHHGGTASLGRSPATSVRGTEDMEKGRGNA